MIVDASVALKWLVVEPDSGEALALLGRSDFAAPTLIHAEVGNAIWKKQRKGEFGPDPELLTLPDRLASIIETVDETPLLARALEIALELDHPIYDCIYLALAEDRGDRLVSADRRFLAKVGQSSFASLVEAL
ncbi:MAG TPA: type II toxin-antitoxin system VapC family toxin [Sphingomonas sp.]|nr:type II toxin-antitoxin system VapC family toxin [Sphingomonas sp.]